MPKADGDDVVPVGEGVGLDDDGVAEIALCREAAAVDLGRDALDDRALAAVGGQIVRGRGGGGGRLRGAGAAAVGRRLGGFGDAWLIEDGDLPVRSVDARTERVDGRVRGLP